LREWPHGWAALRLVGPAEPLREMPTFLAVVWHMPICYALGRSVVRDRYWCWAPGPSAALAEHEAALAEHEAAN